MKSNVLAVLMLAVVAGVLSRPARDLDLPKLPPLQEVGLQSRSTLPPDLDLQSLQDNQEPDGMGVTSELSPVPQLKPRQIQLNINIYNPNISVLKGATLALPELNDGPQEHLIHHQVHKDSNEQQHYVHHIIQADEDGNSDSSNNSNHNNNTNNNNNINNNNNNNHNNKHKKNSSEDDNTNSDNNNDYYDDYEPQFSVVPPKNHAGNYKNDIIYGYPV